MEAFLLAGAVGSSGDGDLRAKMLRPIRKRPHPLNIESTGAFNRQQRENSLSIQSNDAFEGFGKGGKGSSTYICLLISQFNLLFESRGSSLYCAQYKFRK